MTKEKCDVVFTELRNLETVTGLLINYEVWQDLLLHFACLFIVVQFTFCSSGCTLKKIMSAGEMCPVEIFEII